LGELPRGRRLIRRPEQSEPGGPAARRSEKQKCFRGVWIGQPRTPLRINTGLYPLHEVPNINGQTMSHRTASKEEEDKAIKLLDARLGFRLTFNEHIRRTNRSQSPSNSPPPCDDWRSRNRSAGAVLCQLYQAGVDALTYRVQVRGHKCAKGKSQAMENFQNVELKRSQLKHTEIAPQVEGGTPSLPPPSFAFELQLYIVGWWQLHIHKRSWDLS